MKNHDIALDKKSPPFLLPVSSGQQPNENRRRFSNLWLEAEQLMAENQALDQALESLIRRVILETSNAEQTLGNGLREQTDKLITFASRKSLSFSQRDILDEWITTNVNRLSRLGYLDNKLLDRLAELDAITYGITIDPDSEHSAAEQLRQAIEERDRIMATELAEETDNCSDNESDPDYQFTNENDDPWIEDLKRKASSQEQDDFVSNNRNPSNQRDEMDPHELFNKLFHRVARTLHPDKESDPEKRKIKQSLMAQLLETRRQKDLITLISFYQEHVDGDVVFDEQELSQLENNLSQLIKSEKYKRKHLTTQSPMHIIVYRRFYHEDPKMVDEAIEKEIELIKTEKKDIDRFLSTVTSLKKLAPHLKARDTFCFSLLNSY